MNHKHRPKSVQMRCCQLPLNGWHQCGGDLFPLICSPFEFCPERESQLTIVVSRRGVSLEDSCLYSLLVVSQNPTLIQQMLTDTAKLSRKSPAVLSPSLSLTLFSGCSSTRWDSGDRCGIILDTSSRNLPKRTKRYRAETESGG